MRWSLQAKMFVVFALVATIPLVAMSSLALTQTRDAFQDEVGRSHRDRATTAATFVDVSVEGRLVQVAAEAQSPRLRDALSSGNVGELLLELRDFATRTSDPTGLWFVNVTVLNETGRVMGSYPAWAPAGTDVSASPEFVAGRSSGDVVTLPVREAPSPVLPVVAPVFVAGRLQGVLVAEMAFPALAEGLGQFLARSGESFILVDASGVVLAYPTSSQPGNGSWGATVPVQRALSGASGSIEFTDPVTGARSLAGYAPLQGQPWVVVSSVPLDIAYEGVSRLTALLVVLAADLLVAMLFASILVARAVGGPLRRLTDAADAMAQGHLATRIDIERKDEVGDLARSFNTMAERVGSNVEQARRSEERYRSLVESANDMIFAIEPDGVLSFASALSERILGRTPAELVGSRILDAVHPDDRAVFESAKSSVLEHGRSLSRVHIRVVHADGSVRTVLTNLSPLKGGEGGPGRILGVARDVTAELEQEKMREKSFEMARAVSEHAHLDALLSKGLDILLEASGLERGAAYTMRPRATLRLEVTRRAPAGLDALDPAFLMPRSDEPLQDVYERSAPETMAADGVHVLHVVPLIERAETLGVVVLFAPASFHLDPPARQSLAALASQLSVGIRRSLFEARLRDYASELEARVKERTALLVEKSQEMESFLYTVSHDLKAPLISIEGYAQGIEEDFGGALPEEAAHYVQRIRRNAELMESLISDLLEFSRIGRVRDTAGTVDVGEILRKIATRLNDGYARHGGELSLPDSAPRVHGEAKRIEQLFNNLLGNALKYRHPERPPLVQVSARTEGGEAVFDIKDNGRGIPEGGHDKAFQIFQRFVTPGMEDPGGTGMGLAIVKRIAETHGGSVTFESTQGEGTTFHVRLPLRPPEERRPR